MKRIILIILAITLLVISCGNDDTTGAKSTGGGAPPIEGDNSGVNTPAGKSWAGRVGGKTFTTTTTTVPTGSGEDETLVDKIVFITTGVPKGESSTWLATTEDGITGQVFYVMPYFMPAVTTTAGRVVIQEKEVVFSYN